MASTYGAVSQHAQAPACPHQALIHSQDGLRVTANSPHEIRGVTRVTQLSSDSLRARARRTSNESYVTKVLSTLTSDTVTRKLTYQADAGAYAYAVRFNENHVTSVTRLERTEK